MSHICPKGAPCKISDVVFFLASSFRAFTIQSPPLKLITEDLHIRSKRLVRTVLIFTESSDQLSRATDRVPGLPASPGYAQ